MITLRKLESLPERTRGRKILSLLSDVHDSQYDEGIIRLALELMGEPVSSSVPMATQPRDRDRLKYRLARFLGLEVADWDLQAPPDRTEDPVRFPLNAWLDDLRSPFNVGSVLRTAEAYGFSSVWHSPDTPGIDHPRTRRTAMGAEAFLAVGALSLEELRNRWGTRPVFALELGGTPIDRFTFPQEGLVLVGGEELGLGPEALAWADSSGGRVSLPLYGRKASLNVGVAFGILAAHWTRALSPVPRNEG